MATKKRRAVNKSKNKRINRKKAAKRTSAKASKKLTRPGGKRKRTQRRKAPVESPGTAVIYEVVEAEVYEPEPEEEIREA